MASGVIKSERLKLSSPAHWTSAGETHNVTDLTAFEYLIVVLHPSGNEQNRLDFKMIPVSQINFSASNCAVWLNFIDSNGKRTVARLAFSSATSASVTVLTSEDTSFTPAVALYGLS